MAQIRLFISYSRKDTAFAHRLAEDLRSAGYDVWMDISGLRGGQAWARGIDTAVRAADAVLVIVSPDSMESEWVGKETLLAQGLRRLIIPILWRDASMPVHLIDLQWVDFRGDYAAALQLLVGALPTPGAEPAQPTSLPPVGPGAAGRKPRARLPPWAWGASALVVIAAVVASGFAAGLWRLPASTTALPTSSEGAVASSPTGSLPAASQAGLATAQPQAPTTTVQEASGGSTAESWLVVDNADPGFAVEAGEWGTCSYECEGIPYGIEFRFADEGCTGCRARFDFKAPTAGEYDLWTWWPRYDDRSTDTAYTILHAGDPITVTVDQRHSGNAWYQLATVRFESGERGSIVVSGSDTGYANADAIALTPAGTGPPPAEP